MHLLSIRQILFVQRSVFRDLILIWNPAAQGLHVLIELVAQLLHCSHLNFLCQIPFMFLSCSQLALLHCVNGTPDTGGEKRDGTAIMKTNDDVCGFKWWEIKLNHTLWHQMFKGCSWQNWLDPSWWVAHSIPCSWWYLDPGCPGWIAQWFHVRWLHNQPVEHMPWTAPWYSRSHHSSHGWPMHL